MDNQVAINFLDQVRKILLDDKSWLESTEQPINEAFDMAIKALEQSELCNDDKGCSNCMYSGRPTYKSPCSECRDRSQWEMKPISRSHENGTECEDTISRQAAIDVVCAACGNDCDKSKFVYDALQDDQIIMCPEHYGLTQLPSAQSKKFSEVLQDMMDEDYYLFCHTGYSRLAEKDWEWLIEQVKEMEQKRRTDDCI